MYIVLLALAITLCMFLLARWFVKASPAEIKRLMLFISLVLLLLLSIAFFKFGGVIIAAIALAIPIVRRVYTLFATYQYFRKMKENNKASHQQRHPSSNTMSEGEAREVLGVSKNATAAEIKAAYHALMQKNHPDQGGSEYFAKKLNQARDVLLKN